MKPQLVCEVSFGEWTRDGKIRHAGVPRPAHDKPAEAIGEEPVLHAPPPKPPTAAAQGARAQGRPRRRREPEGLRIATPPRGRPASGITKIDLVRYYARWRRWMLPHLKGRPIAGARARRHRGPAVLPEAPDRTRWHPGIERAGPRSWPGPSADGEIAEPEALLGAAQMNVVEFHTWNAVVRTIDQPDRMTFDLDPGEGVAWAQMQEAAQLVRALLEELGLRGLAQDQRRQGPAPGGAARAAGWTGTR